MAVCCVNFFEISTTQEHETAHCTSFPCFDHVVRSPHSTYSMHNSTCSAFNLNFSFPLLSTPRLPLSSFINMPAVKPTARSRRTIVTEPTTTTLVNPFPLP